MEMCMSGAGVCRTWSELEMVRSFGGGEIPGTPDFMYESKGMLTCGQVVRVPLLPRMTRTAVTEIIYFTVLTKLVKSQVWMKSCCIVPHEFIIFCWLPAVSIHRNRMRSAKALVLQLQRNGWPFRLRFEVPDDPESLFPSRFASSCKPHLKKLSQADLSDFNPMDFEEEEDPID